MKDGKLRVTGTGDSLFVAPFPENYSKDFEELKSHIASCDVKMTNLETNLSDFEYCGNAYSGGTWLNTKREYLKYLKGFDFNYYGNANNHAMDYGHAGLLSTIRTLDEHRLAHSGTGASLAEAEKPAILEIDGKKIAIFAVDASYETASKAGNATNDLSARAGVNYLGHNDYYHVTQEQIEQLKQIAKDTHVNFYRELSVKTGFLNLDPEGSYVFAGKTFTIDKSKPTSECNPKDLKRILNNVKKAKEENDYVFMLVHCHNDNGISHNAPAEYLKQFCRCCIDAGVSAVFGGGVHELCPIEIYNGKPIFYSLGDFIYQGMRVEYLPADFMEQYNADINITALEALQVRSRGGKVGLHLMEENFLSLLPKIEFTDGEMTDLTIMPLYLNFKATDYTNGLPAIAKGEKAQEILDKMNEMSAPFGTKLELVDGAFKIKK